MNKKLRKLSPGKILNKLFRLFGRLRSFFYYFGASGIYIGPRVEIDSPERVVLGRNVELESDIQLLCGGAGGVSLGAEVVIKKGCILRCFGGNIAIGPESSLNPYCIIYGNGGVSIGRGVRIAANTQFYASNHKFDNPELQIHEQGLSKVGISVGDNVWIGANVIVLDGVEIGSNVVIAAGSVINKSFPSNVLVAGTPARIIRQLDSQARD